MSVQKIARVKRNLQLDTRMTQIDVILLFDGITLLQGIAEEKEKCNASASANFVQVLCKHFPLFYIVFSKVIPTFARKTLFYAILARFFTIFWLFSGSFWSWGGRGRWFKSRHSDQVNGGCKSSVYLYFTRVFRTFGCGIFLYRASKKCSENSEKSSLYIIWYIGSNGAFHRSVEANA